MKSRNSDLRLVDLEEDHADRQDDRRLYPALYGLLLLTLVICAVGAYHGWWR